jgi:YD repeat-containing protein
MFHYKYILLSTAVALTLSGCGNTGTTETSLMTNSLTSHQASITTSGTTTTPVKLSPLAVMADIETIKLPKYINTDYTLPSDINWTLCNCGDFNLTDHTIMIEDIRCETSVELQAQQGEMTKYFSITILPKALTPQEIVAQDIRMVSGNYFPLQTPLNRALGIVAPNGSTITWSIENDGYSIDAVTGAITKNEKSGKSTRAAREVLDSVTIKGTFVYEDVTEEAYFDVTLLSTESTPESTPAPTLHYVVDKKFVDGVLYQYFYDSYGNVILEKIDYEQDGVFDNQKVFINSYDERGNLIEQRREGIEDYWIFEYDAGNVLTKKIHTRPNQVVETYMYVEGKLTSAEIVHPEYTSTLTYVTDSFGNIVEETETTPFGTRTLEYSYTYDSNGNLIEKRGKRGVMFTQTWKVLESEAL